MILIYGTQFLPPSREFLFILSLENLIMSKNTSGDRHTLWKQRLLWDKNSTLRLWNAQIRLGCWWRESGLRLQKILSTCLRKAKNVFRYIQEYGKYILLVMHLTLSSEEWWSQFINHTHLVKFGEISFREEKLRFLFCSLHRILRYKCSFPSMKTLCPSEL